MDKNISYDGIFKELLDEFPSENIIGLINKLFELNHPKDSKVLKLSTETHNDGTERRSDMVLKIGDDMYHVELQSLSDISDNDCYPSKYAIRAISETPDKIAA